MTLQDWGSIGELVGAIAVVITLIYLAKQIRLNTHAMDEGRKLALAQTYQMRSDALQAMLVEAADSDHIGPIIAAHVGMCRVLSPPPAWSAHGGGRGLLRFRSGTPGVVEGLAG